MKQNSVCAALAGLTLVSALMSFCLVSRWLQPAESVFLPRTRQSRTLVIDPGHGGEDGGAVSAGGVAESGINLSIALKCEQVAGLYGVDTVTLRREDVSLAGDGAGSLRQRKRSDLQRRVEIVRSTPNARLLSIHQNKYSSPASHGAQVFYRPDDESRRWAESTQSLLKTAVDPENRRQVKQIPEEIYLMSHITCPAILVECGFLSHPAEAERLQQEDYQRRLAAVLVGSFLTQESGATSP